MRDFLSLKDLENFSKETIVKMQNDRFRATASYLLPEVPFYKKLFKKYKVDPESIKKVEDWKALPLIKKATYKKNPRDFIVSPKKQEALSKFLKFNSSVRFIFEKDKEKVVKGFFEPKMLIFSGGTESGSPTPVALTASQKFTNLQNILEIIGELLIKRLFKEQRLIGMNLFPYAPHLGWHAVHMALDLNADLNLCTAAGGAMRSEYLVQMAGKLKPNIFCGMCSYMKNRWLPLAIEKKIRLPETIVYINGAQKMHDVERFDIQNLFGKLGVKKCVVLDLYGASELKEALLPECSPGSGYHHVAPLSSILKTVEVHKADELITDWDFTEDEGYACSWNIDGAGSLLEGFLIGDKFGRAEWNRCPVCKLNTYRIHDVNRIREVEAQLKLTGMVEEKVKGTRINLADVRDAALKVKGVREAQVVVKKNKKDELILNFYADNPASVKKRIEKAFKQFEFRPKLKSISKSEFESKKIKIEGIKIVRKS